MSEMPKEALELAEKIEYAVKTSGEITLFKPNGLRVVYALRRLSDSDTALTRIRELEGAFAALGADPATPAWIQTFARALSSKDQEKTPLPFHDETMDGLNAMTIRKPV